MSDSRLKTGNKIISVVLAVVMVLGTFPIAVFGATDLNSNAFTFEVTDEDGNSVDGANISYAIFLSGSYFAAGSAVTQQGEAVIPEFEDCADDLAAGETATISYTVSCTGFFNANGEKNVTDPIGSVSVELESIYATVSVKKTGFGTVELNGTATDSLRVEKSSDVSVTVTPGADNYYIGEVVINGISQDISDSKLFETVIIDVTEDIEVVVSFISVYTVSVSSGEGGRVFVNGSEIIEKAFEENSQLSVEIRPDDGYQVTSVSVDGRSQEITDADGFAFSLTVTGDIEIAASFVKVYSITVTYDSEKGSVQTAPSGEGGVVTVEVDTEVEIVAVPGEFYRVSKVEITGAEDEVYTDNRYNFSNPYTKTLTADNDYDVVITFAPLIYNMTLTSSENGSIYSDSNTVLYGESATVTIRPDDGYSISSALVNGEDILSLIKETDNDSVFELVLDEIVGDIVVEITFEECESASLRDISWNSDDAVRVVDDLYIFAKDETVVFETDYKGIRITYKDKTSDGDKGTNSVEITSNKEICKIEVRYDYGWHEVLINGESVEIDIYFDLTQPTVTVEASEEANRNGYYNSNVPIVINAKDSGTFSGIAEISYKIVVDEEETEPEIIYSSEDEISNEIEIDNIVIDAVTYNGESVKVVVVATDLAGNESEEVVLELSICTVNPIVVVSFSDKQSDEATEDWYNFNRTATITITDRSDVFDETAAVSGISFAEDSVSDYVISDWITDGDAHIATVTFSSEGTYSWSYSYTNKADLEAVVAENGDNIYEFRIDTTAPEGVIKAQSSVWSDEGFSWSVLLEKLTFGLYTTEEVTVGLVTGTGTDLLSGYQSVCYYMSDSDEILAESELIARFEAGEFQPNPYTISEEGQYTIYARLVDNAGNYKFIGTEGVIYDVTGTEITLSAIDTPNEDSMYGVNTVKEYTVDEETIRGIKIQVNVDDINDDNDYYSGIKNVVYSVEMNGVQTQSGNLFEFTEDAPEKSELYDCWEGYVIIDADKNNGKNITLTVNVTDNAGNESDNSFTIKEIDVDELTAEVTVTGTAITLEDGFGWFDSSRTATVTIIDRSSTFDQESAENSIVFSLADMDGNAIETEEGDVEFSEWINIGENRYSTEVTFNKTGNYTWGINYINKAGNELDRTNIDYGTSESPSSFAIDRTSPNGSITIGESTWIDSIISFITFGIYTRSNSEITVVAYDGDNISPVTVEYYEHIGENALSEASLDALYNDGEFVSELPVASEDQLWTLYVRITDKVNNYIYVSSDGYIVDATQTELTVEAIDAPNSDGFYGISDVVEYDDVASGIKVSILARESEDADAAFSGIKELRYEVRSKLNGEYTVTQEGGLYSFSYTRTDAANSNGGYLVIRDSNGYSYESEQNAAVPTKDMLCREWAGVITVDAEKNNSSEVDVIVYVTDNSGNTKYETLTLDIDLVAPVITVEYDNNSVVNEKYFSAPRTAVVTYTERADHFDQIKAEDLLVESITATDINGKEIEEAYSITWDSNTDTQDPDKNTFTAVIEFNKDANYTVSFAYADKAGNSNNYVAVGESAAPYDFVIDTVDPYGSVDINGNVWSKFIDTLTFGLFSNSKAVVSAQAGDDTSPVIVEYYKLSNSTEGINALYVDDLEFVSYEPFEVSENELFAVYVKITDMAGHSVFISTDGFIVDAVMSTVNIGIVDRPNTNGVYGIDDIREYEVEDGTIQGVRLSVNVSEDSEVYSGIARIEYEITSEFNGETETTQSGVLYSFDYTRDEGDNSNGGTVKTVDENGNTSEASGQMPSADDLLYAWNGEIVVDAEKNNSSNVTIKVTVTDNAGNISEDIEVLDIDLDSPVVNISFDNNSALNGKYFPESRTATIAITERRGHFSSIAATSGIAVNGVDREGDTIENCFAVSGWAETVDANDSDNVTHSTTVLFSGDANYTFSFSYTGLAGNDNADIIYAEGTVQPNEFTVDTTAPTGAIKVNERIWNKILNILTFGLFFRVKADISISAEDNMSPISIAYYKTNDPINKAESVLNTMEFIPYEEFTVNSDEQFVVYARILDYAGNYTYIQTDGYIIDFTQPDLVLTADAPNENRAYNSDVKIKIDAEDAEPYSGIAKVEYWVVCDYNDSSISHETQRQTLFSFDYSNENEADSNTGELVITDWAEGSEHVTTLTGNVPTQAQLYKTWSGTVTVSSELNNSSYVRVYVGVTDNAGNYIEQSVNLDIDITAPVISVTYEDTANDNAHNGYYLSRTATISIKERSNHFNSTLATNGISITAVDASGNHINGAYTISSWTTVKGSVADEDVQTATITYSADANYEFAVSYTDKADNANKTVDMSGQQNPYKFTVDTTAPSGTLTAQSAEGRSEIWSSVVDSLTFGFWSNSKISLSSTADDATSPIDSVMYYTSAAKEASDNTSVLKKADLDAVTEWKAFNGFNVTDNSQFTVYLKVTDYAGNYTYISTNGLIVDEEHPIEESVAPEITVSPQQPINGIYNGNVKVSIEVKDPMVGGTYSGLKSISYKVYDRASSTPDVPTQEGTLFTFNNNSPKQSELRQSWSGEITVSSAKNNSNNIQVVVYAVDNALNSVDNSQKESKSYTVIKIDTTKPVINISYDNNNADSSTYFNANRTATISVVERNFNPDDVKITIKNTDGVIPAIVGWKNTAGTYNNDNAVHTATVTYNADGDYSFAVEYTDNAGNKCSSVNYVGGTVAGAQFTIDKTVPTVSVSYSNNSAVNSNYYSAPRTASVVINEHNFSAQRVNISLSATNDGAAASIPSVTSWTSSGDRHTAIIYYSGEALYTFDIEFRDLAGNSIANYTQESFYVDNISPVVTIENVENMQAYGDVISPVITISDTNFNADNVNITLEGVNNGKVTPVGSYSEIHNGRVFVFADFERTAATDDIYTLTASATDMAGRTTTSSTRFSVNRFGSIYTLTDETNSFNDTYVIDAPDVVIHEVNANELSNIKITLFKNNEPMVLKNGTDYKISVTGGDGQWYEYVYTIFKGNFADDGTYSITIYSEDEAGNVSDNTLDTKETKIVFGVDKTPPTINIKNLESGITYALDTLDALFTVSDNLQLKDIVVSLDGQEKGKWTGDALEAMLTSGEDFTFNISGDSIDSHNVVIKAIDAAGNEIEQEVSDFYVTTNIWVRYYNNKPLFFGSIGGVIAVAGAAVALVVLRRRKSAVK